jgi:membrane-associated protein
MKEFILEVFQTLFNAEKLRLFLTYTLSGWYTYAFLAAVVFSETGLLLGFFLPGDSLLFIVGVVAGAGTLNIGLVNLILIPAAIVGVASGYQLGRRAGPMVYSRPDSRFFKQEHLRRTKEFYEKHGGKTIILAQWMPIIRTFAPFVAGVAQMPYPRFFMFNVVGSITWVGTLTTLGYLLGNQPLVVKHLEKVILGIIFISVAPVAWHALSGRGSKSS